MKTSAASPSCPRASGSASTCRSGFAPAGISARPMTAIGSTRKDSTNRYSGNAQPACRRRSSSLASTTITWNMWGSTSTAEADSPTSTSQRSGRIIQAAPSGVRASAAMRASTSDGPSASPHSTQHPTATKAASLTTASAAIAITTP